MPPGIGYGPNKYPYLTQIDPSRLQAEPGPSGLMALLNRPGVRDGLMAFGLNMLASDKRRETTGQALARSLPQGLAAYGQGQQEGQWEQVLASMPDGPQKEMFRILGPQAGAGALMQMMQPGEGFTLGENQVRFDAGGNPIAEGPKPAVEPDRRVIEGNLVQVAPDGTVTTLYESPDEVQFDDVAALRNRFEANTKPYEDAAQAFRKMEASATGEATPAKDIAIVFNYMKTVDPTSSVREGEFATAQNSGSAWTVAGNLYNRLLTGQRLNATQRAEFLNSAREQLASQLPQYQTIADQYRAIAESNSFEPAQVIRNPFAGLNLAAPTAQPDPLGIR